MGELAALQFHLGVYSHAAHELVPPLHAESFRGDLLYTGSHHRNMLGAVWVFMATFQSFLPILHLFQIGFFFVVVVGGWGCLFVCLFVTLYFSLTIECNIVI